MQILSYFFNVLIYLIPICCFLPFNLKIKQKLILFTILFINILLSISGSIQVYEIPYIMMNGSNGTVTPVIQIQQSAFSDDRLGFAAALSIVVFIVVVIAVCLQNIVTKRGEE